MDYIKTSTKQVIYNIQTRQRFFPDTAVVLISSLLNTTPKQRDVATSTYATSSTTLHKQQLKSYNSNKTMKAVSTILSAALISSAVAFAPSKQSVPAVQSLKAAFDPLDLAEPKTTSENNTVMKVAATAAASFALTPLAAMAGE